jgi:hypothetical protein
LWKEAWLQSTAAEQSGISNSCGAPGGHPPGLRTKSDDSHYSCQSTELAKATSYLRPISLRRCTAEWQAGNLGWWQCFRYVWLPVVFRLKRRLLGPASVQLVGRCRKTPSEALNLQPGELVEVKSAQEIAATLDSKGRNRGLEFGPHMMPFCGKRFVVKTRLERLIMEKNGEMRRLENTVLLEGAVCDGWTVLGGCLRNSHHFWREVWLRRVKPD